MSKNIKKIVIGLDGIEVFSEINGVKNITQLNLIGEEKEISDIFEKYNLSNIIIYEYDEKILRALALDESGEQLRDYLEICKRVTNGEKNIKLAKNMPEVEYDLRSLRKYGN